MSLYDNFTQEALVDLLKAYDCYISYAADSGLLTTGWTPVCVEEFYDNEYQNVWDREKGGESFDYMYDHVEKLISEFHAEEKSDPSLISHKDSDLLPVNMVTLIRERPSEEEHWSDSFWVDARVVPTIDLFKKAVHDYLETGDGRLAIMNSCEDFNWGDAMMEIPEFHWNANGIYAVNPETTPAQLGLVPTPNSNPVTFTVDQDEVLIPDSYYEQKQPFRPLDAMIRSAEARRTDASDHQRSGIEPDLAH